MSDINEASFVLGIEIARHRARTLSMLSQRSYLHQVHKRFSMQNCSPSETPIVKGDKYCYSEL